MDVVELCAAHDAVTGDQTAAALDDLVLHQVPAAQGCPAGRTHRSTLAQGVLAVLFGDLLGRVPSARTYVRARAVRGHRIFLDHGAVRTVAWPTASDVPAGIEQVSRVLEPLGWRQRETYPLPKLKMTGTSWAHLDAPDEIGQWFVSELHPDDFSAPFRSTVERVLGTAVDPLDDVARAALAELAATDSVPDGDAPALLGTLVRCFGRLHEMPTEQEYERLLTESPEMAWIATEGTAFNHATDRVDDVAATAEEERASGRPIKERVEVSGSGRVRQTAHRAAMVERTFPSVDSTVPTVRTVPGSFFEFIERAPLPDGSGVDLAFDTSNAQGIFAMTRSDPAAADDEPGVATDPELEPGPDPAAGAVADGARVVTRSSLTFKVRRRHLSDKRAAELDEWSARWTLPIDGPVIEWPEVFGRDAGIVLDIGFGHGESTIQLARDEPDLDIVGVEVHDPGVVTVLDAIENEPLHNIRVVHGDVVRFIRRIGPASLVAARIFFPDPWPKVRQRHRRLVRDDMVAALTDRLRVDGELHLATDVADYAEEMRRACENEPRLSGGIVSRPDDRPVTRFERRGLAEGRSAVDLRYRRVR